MLYCRHESLFTRFTAASRASGRCRREPGRDCQDVCCLGGDDQTLYKTTTRERSRFAKGDPRPSCADRSAVAGPLESAVRSPSRCDARRALSAVPSRTGHRGEYGQHQSRQNCPGLDAKKKTLVAREQDESARAAWREQARQVGSQDLVFVDETGSHIAMTPLYAYAPRGQRVIGKVPRNSGANTTQMASLSRQGMGEAFILERCTESLSDKLLHF